MPRRKKAIFLVALIALSGAAAGLAGEPLTLHDARRLVLERNAALKQAELTARSSRLDREIAAGEFLPDVALEGSAAGAYPATAAKRNDDLDWSASVGFSATQKLYAGGARLAALKQSAVVVSQSDAELLSARLAALKEADTRYLDVLEKTQLKEAADKDLAAARLFLEVAEAKRAAGILDPASFLKTKSDFASKQTVALQAGYDLSLGRMKFASLTGAAAEAALAPMNEARTEALAKFMRELPPAELERFIGVMIEAGRKLNPDLRKKELVVSLAEATADGKLAAFLPTVSIGWSQVWSQTEYTALSGGGKLTLSGSIPLFPWQGRLANLGKADISTQSARLASADGLREFVLAIRGALLDLAASANKLESARAALDYAQEHYNQVLEKFKLSAAAVSDLYDAEALLSSSRSQDISNQFTLFKAWTSLLYGIGLEEESRLLEIMAAAGYVGLK